MQCTKNHFMIDVNFSILKSLIETTVFHKHSTTQDCPANIANFVLPVLLEINKANEICKLET